MYPNKNYAQEAVVKVVLVLSKEAGEKSAIASEFVLSTIREVLGEEDNPQTQSKLYADVREYLRKKKHRLLNHLPIKHMDGLRRCLRPCKKSGSEPFKKRHGRSHSGRR